MFNTKDAENDDADFDQIYWPSVSKFPDPAEVQM